MKVKELILTMGCHEKQFNALYRELASEFSISDCGLWVLYYVLITDEGISQQELQELMMFPKQTINSAVSALVKKGLIWLEVIPGTKNRKKILLTEKGKVFTDRTVSKILNAEISSVKKLGVEKMQQYLILQEEYLKILQEQFREEGLTADEQTKSS